MIVQPGDHLEHGGLAAAGRADEGDKLTLRYVECNVGYGEESFSAGLELIIFVVVVVVVIVIVIVIAVIVIDVTIVVQSALK